MKADIKFHFLTAVWGEAYVETFLSVALPNQLSPGNIPSLRSLDRCIYKIFTTDEDAERIKAAPALKSLVNLMPVEVVTMRGVDLNASKYDLSTQCYRQGIHDADKVGAAIFQVPPDAVWSDGTFTNAEQKAFEGYRLYAMAGPSVVKEAFVPMLKDHYWQADRNCITISARNLSSAILRHLHPIMMNHFWHSSTFTKWPSAVFWRVGDEGMVLRQFHLHPLMLHPLVKGVRMPGSHDGKYISSVCPDPALNYIVTDSDEATVCEMSVGSRRNEAAVPNTPNPQKILDWVRNHTDHQNLHNFRQTIRIHGTDIGEEWKQVEESVERVLRPIIAGAEQAIKTDAKAVAKRLSPRFLYEKLREIGPVSFLKRGARKSMRVAACCMMSPLTLWREVKELRARVAQLEAYRNPSNRSADERGDGPLQTLDESASTYARAFGRAFDYLVESKLSGCVVKFGCLEKDADRAMAALMKHRKYDADFCFFHSFEEPLSDVTSAWANADLQIMQTLETLIAPDRISVVHGEVDDALKSRLQIEKAALIQIGHHLYSSTKTILEKLSQRDVLQDGCIVLFNEFNCNRANESTGQRRALREFLESQERWTCSPWFSYGWHGQVYFFHDRQFVCESRLQTLHAA